MRAKAGKGKPKFRVGQVVCCHAMGKPFNYERIKSFVKRRTFVYLSDLGLVMPESLLRPLTPRESGQRFRERSK